uniref:Uncharacterized protein n=1 Tax=Labrus bergylta TaxID=56723 RepID=A0A3Q3E619_9LABR
MFICNVPDLAGFPPSTAVRMSLITACFSRSKAFCSTNSADTPSVVSSDIVWWVSVNSL